MTSIDPSVVPSDLIAIADDLLDWQWEETQIAGRSWPLAVAADPDAMLLDACGRRRGVPHRDWTSILTASR